MTLYCNSAWQVALQKQLLTTFDQILDYPIRWIDMPISLREMFRHLDHIEAGMVSLVRERAGSYKRIKNSQAIVDKNCHK